jgi:FkbM family methyltransferase
MKYYSQIGQDKQYLEYSKKRNGYYIEIGANDGITFSNTKLLEELKWNGICIEANPQAFKKLIKNRTCKNIQCAVFDYDGDISFKSGDDSLVGGITSELVDTWEKADKKQWVEQKVRCKTLYQILEEENVPKIIDYISIDTEGSEFIILDKFFQDNKKKYKFGYVDIEHNYDTRNYKRIKVLMEANGYKFLKNNQWDYTFILKD